VTDSNCPNRGATRRDIRACRSRIVPSTSSPCNIMRCGQCSWRVTWCADSGAMVSKRKGETIHWLLRQTLHRLPTVMISR
jgi:hypothetical protein